MNACTGAPLAGVAMTGLPGSIATGAEGAYDTAVVPGWSGTITPVKAGYTFTPPSRTYDNVEAALAGQDYEAARGYARADVNRDGRVDALDVQLVVNAVLGALAEPAMCDVDANGDVNAIDVQAVVNAVLGVQRR